MPVLWYVDMARPARQRSNDQKPFHNDVCDLLAMYVQDCASSGGESLLASSAAVYNEIAATRPDVIKTLAEPVWVYDK